MTIGRTMIPRQRNRLQLRGAIPQRPAIPVVFSEILFGWLFAWFPLGGTPGPAPVWALGLSSFGLLGCATTVILLGFDLTRVRPTSLEIYSFLGAVIGTLGFFAATYRILSLNVDGAFNVPLHGAVEATYFVTTIASTVGFGDITPQDSLARVLVTAQMVFDLLALGYLVAAVLRASHEREKEGQPPT